MKKMLSVIDEIEIYAFIAALASESGSETQGKSGVECENYEMKFLGVFKKVFNEGQNCAPCDTTARGKLIAVEKKASIYARDGEGLDYP